MLSVRNSVTKVHCSARIRAEPSENSWISAWVISESDVEISALVRSRHRSRRVDSGGRPVRCAGAAATDVIMSPATVVDAFLEFTLRDADQALRQVRLDCDDAVWGPRRFRRTAAGWGLRLPRPDLERLEYRFVVTNKRGATVVILDPDNPRRVATAFGYRSVAVLPGYEEPGWLRLADIAPAGAARRLVVSAEDFDDLPLQAWSPPGAADDSPLPLLVVHDGPEMVRLAGLDRYAAAMIGGGALPPFRMMLCQPVHRDEWYAANPAYLSAEVNAIREIAASYGTDLDRVVVMGASLGGLTALLLGLGQEFGFAGVLSQSGSFFTPELDPQESSYPWFGRIADAVRVLEPAAHRPMPIALTCGATEENAANNRELAERLRVAGHVVTYREFADLHNYTAWRDVWEPVLTDLLRTCWLGVS
jgi:enterochelin esterase family protein